MTQEQFAEPATDQVVAQETTEHIDSGRRSLLTKGVLAAAVGAVAGTTLSRTANAVNGDTLYVGTTEDATNTTELTGGTTFRVVNGDSSGSASIYGTQGGSDGDHGVRGDHAGTEGNGVYGRATGSQGRGVFGYSNAGGGFGIYGQYEGGTTSGTGVKGLSDNGPGVVGESTAGVGVQGDGSSFDFSARGTGRIFVTSGAAITPTTASSGAGVLGRDDSGGLWWSAASGVWRKLADSETAGAFHPIDPARAFDSRFTSALTVPSTRTISVKDSIDENGAVAVADIVPAGASAVAANVTITRTVGRGFVGVNPGGNTSSGASTANWSGDGVTVANAGIFKLNSTRQLELIVGGLPGGSTDVLVDITGFYL